MWSIYLLLNKLLKADEGDFDGSDGNHLNFVETYTIQHSSNKDQCKTSTSSHFVKVPHINQQHTWDCGLACVQMVLSALGVYGCNIQDLEDLCRTTSIWTVDLAYLLQKFSISFTYCTVTLGANPDFSVETFYKEQLPNDLVRVNMLFQEAREAGICIEFGKRILGFVINLRNISKIGEGHHSPLRCLHFILVWLVCRSVSTKEISEFILSGKYVAIALVDQYKLSHSRLDDVCISDFYSGGPGYTGHYVVICGYDAVTNEFEIRDPASSRKHERITSWCLEQAHKSFGTDEDLLLISLEKGGSQDNPLGLFPCDVMT